MLHKWPAKAVEVEHIWGRKGPGSECWSNYASTCRPCHEWKHANETPARIAISLWKASLAFDNRDPRHFDLDALRKASGFMVNGWVERKLQEGSLPEWVTEMGYQFLGEYW